MENKNKASLRKPDCNFGSQLRVGNVLAPRPETVPLTE